MYLPSVHNAWLAPLSIVPLSIPSNRKNSKKLATQVQWKGNWLNMKLNTVCWCYSCYNLPNLPKSSPVCDGRRWDHAHLNCSVVGSGEAWQTWTMQGHNTSVSSLPALLEGATTEAAKSPLLLWFIVWDIKLSHPSCCPSMTWNSRGIHGSLTWITRPTLLKSERWLAGLSSLATVSQFKNVRD